MPVPLTWRGFAAPPLPLRGRGGRRTSKPGIPWLLPSRLGRRPLRRRSGGAKFLQAGPRKTKETVLDFLGFSLDSLGIPWILSSEFVSFQGVAGDPEEKSFSRPPSCEEPQSPTRRRLAASGARQKSSIEADTGPLLQRSHYRTNKEPMPICQELSLFSAAGGIGAVSPLHFHGRRLRAPCAMETMDLARFAGLVRGGRSRGAGA